MPITLAASLLFISNGERNGPCACCVKVSTRPSQNSPPTGSTSPSRTRKPKAGVKLLYELWITARVPKTPRRLPCGTPMREPFKLANPVAGEWQLTQAVPGGSDKLGSLKIFSPRSCKAVRAGTAGFEGFDAAGAGAGATATAVGGALTGLDAAAEGEETGAGGLGAGPPGGDNCIPGLGGAGGGPGGGGGAASAADTTSE